MFLKVNPKKVIIEGVEYNINTDFRVILEIESIVRDKTISEREKTLAFLFKLYGEKGLKAYNHYEKLLELGQKFILLGKNVEEADRDLNMDMDIIEDIGYIKSSYRQDYNYDPFELEYLHWYDFINDLSNLSNSEFGNCCVLSRVRNLRNYDTSKIKDEKEKRKIEKAKESVQLKNLNEKKFSVEEQENIKKFLDSLEKGG